MEDDEAIADAAAATGRDLTLTREIVVNGIRIDPGVYRVRLERVEPAPGPAMDDHPFTTQERFMTDEEAIRIARNSPYSQIVRIPTPTKQRPHAYIEVNLMERPPTVECVAEQSDDARRRALISISSIEVDWRTGLISSNEAMVAITAVLNTNK